MSGWLLHQNYGYTDPPGDGVLVQRDDEMDTFEGDLDAALAYAASIGGTAHAIFVGDGTGEAAMAHLSDAWVVQGGPGGLVKHTLAEAVANDWYTPLEEDA